MVTISDLRIIDDYLRSSLKYEDSDIRFILDYLISHSSDICVDYHLNEPVLFSNSLNRGLFWYEIHEMLNPLDIEQ